MKKELFLFCLIISLAIQCKKEKQIIPENQEFFKAFSMKDPDSHVVIDTLTNFLYFYDNEDKKVFNYNYETFSVGGQSLENPYHLTNYQFGAGYYNDEPEIYVGTGQSISIFDGITLDFKDSIRIFDSSDSRIVVSIEPSINNLIFIGACNSSFNANNSPKGSLVLNRQTKEIISQAFFGANCMRLRTYVNNDGNSIDVIGIGFGNPVLTLDKYDYTGNVFENNKDFFPDATTSKHLIKTNSDIDYFITSSQGNIFSKEDLSLINTLDSEYRDIVISNDNKKFYGLSSFEKKLEIVNYPSKTIDSTRELEDFGFRAFIDNNILIIVYFVYPESRDGRDVYISKIPI